MLVPEPVCMVFDEPEAPTTRFAALLVTYVELEPDQSVGGAEPTVPDSISHVAIGAPQVGAGGAGAVVVVRVAVANFVVSREST